MTEKASVITFVVAAAGFALSLIIGGATGNMIIGIRVAAVLFTLGFTAISIATFRSGVIRFGRNWIEIHRRDDAPSFYLTAIIHTALSAGICALFLWLAFFG
jgi:hypothetical protein